MLKLSKSHQIKLAEDNEEDKYDKELGLDLAAIKGSDVENNDDDDDADLADDSDSEEDTENEKSPKSDARREAATPHAHAAKDLFSKRRELMGQVNMLDEQLAKHRDVLRALDPKMKHEAYADDKELRVYLKPDKLIEKKKKKKLDKKSELEVMDGLLKVAEVLDYAGHAEGVSLVENVLRIFAKNEEVSKYNLQTIEKSERKYPDVEPYAPSLSTRNCPDHHGAPMHRVAEASFQCSLDGKIYNWNTGFKDYAGNVYPGAQISSVDFPNTNEKMFQTREMATNSRAK